MRLMEMVRMPALLKDHGLPLIQLKERRRDLIVALMGRHAPVSEQQISEIAAIQSAIAAFEAVLEDLDAEAEVPRSGSVITTGMGNSLSRGPLHLP